VKQLGSIQYTLNVEFATINLDRSVTYKRISCHLGSVISPTGKLGAILIMPLEIAEKNGLSQPSDAIVEEIENGSLIKKKQESKLR
jgi:hypothetical protein